MAPPATATLAERRPANHGMLQPMAAYPCAGLGMFQIEVRKDAGRKAVELLGQ
jgi:hypothetical protein